MDVMVSLPFNWGPGQDLVIFPIAIGTLGSVIGTLCTVVVVITNDAFWDWSRTMTHESSSYLEKGFGASH